MISTFTSDKDCLSGDISNHQVDVMNLVKDISSLTSQIRELQYYTKYMQVIGKIEDLRYRENIQLLIKGPVIIYDRVGGRPESNE